MWYTILDLILICDKIDKLSPYCVDCGEKGIITNAIFSKKKHENVVYQAIAKCTSVLIGGSDQYKPVCRNCYNN